LLEEELAFNYPVLEYPAKLTSLNLDKNPEVAGELRGIKGQYLILSTGVINMRKYGGYELEWEAEPAGESAPAPAPQGQNAGQTAPISSASQLKLL
jgi:hypothetical protein